MRKSRRYRYKGKSESLAASGFPDGRRINLQQKDDPPFQRTVLSGLRIARVSDFISLKREIEAYGETLDGPFRRARRILTDFGRDTPSSTVSLWSADADDNTSLSNDEWSDNMDRAYGKLSDYLDDLNRLSNAFLEGLEKIEIGEWN